MRTCRTFTLGAERADTFGRIANALTDASVTFLPDDGGPAPAYAKGFSIARTANVPARSHVLLEVNARWIASTDRFLHAVKNNRPWPTADVAMQVATRTLNERSPLPPL